MTPYAMQQLKCLVRDETGILLCHLRVTTVSSTNHPSEGSTWGHNCGIYIDFVQRHLSNVLLTIKFTRYNLSIKVHHVKTISHFHYMWFLLHCGSAVGPSTLHCSRWIPGCPMLMSFTLRHLESFWVTPSVNENVCDAHNRHYLTQYLLSSWPS